MHWIYRSSWAEQTSWYWIIPFTFYKGNISQFMETFPLKNFFFLSEFSSLHFFIRVKLSLPQKALSDMAAQLFPFMYQHYVLDIMVIVKHNLLSRTFIFLLHLAKSYWLFRPALGSVVRLMSLSSYEDGLPRLGEGEHREGGSIFPMLLNVSTYFFASFRCFNPSESLALVKLFSYTDSCLDWSFLRGNEH